MADPIAQLLYRLEEMEIRLQNMMRAGTVSAVDHEKGLVKLKTDEWESDWITWTEMAGGASTRTMPTMGQAIMGMFPGGQAERGFAIPGHDTEANALPPAPQGQHVYKRGQLTITNTDDTTTVEMGGATWQMTPQRITQTIGGVTLVMEDGVARLQTPKFEVN